MIYGIFRIILFARKTFRKKVILTNPAIAGGTNQVPEEELHNKIDF